MIVHDAEFKGVRARGKTEKERIRDHPSFLV